MHGCMNLGDAAGMAQRNVSHVEPLVCAWQQA